MTTENEIDVDDLNALGMRIGPILRDHLAAPPHSRGRVLTALNALALLTSYLLAGIEDETERESVKDWFDEAVVAEVQAVRRIAKTAS